MIVWRSSNAFGTTHQVTRAAAVQLGGSAVVDVTTSCYEGEK